MYRLYIANKNYSSWSLRPWVLMREHGIPFDEHLLPFGDGASWEAYGRLVRSRRVPGLIDGDTVVWESLAIAEYLAERHDGIWPADAISRAWARCAAAEMHSGFTELRNRCSMTCGVRIRLNEFPPALERDVARLSELWTDGLGRFGGPFLAGAAFTAVDAFFAPRGIPDRELRPRPRAGGGRLCSAPAVARRDVGMVCRCPAGDVSRPGPRRRNAAHGNRARGSAGAVVVSCAAQCRPSCASSHCLRSNPPP